MNTPERLNLGDWWTIRVAAKRQDTPDIFVYDLVDINGGQLPGFHAGAHIEIEAGELIRQYSISHFQAEPDRYVLGIKNESSGRGGSKYICANINVGDLIRVRGPHSNFKLQPKASESILIAGGIGITPLLCMAEYLDLQDSPFVLHYFSRSRDHAAFRTLLETARFAPSVVLHFDDGQQIRQGDLAQLIGTPASQRNLYICGPGPMIDWVTDTAISLGWRQANVHFERFAADQLVASRPQTEFFIELTSSDRRILVPPNVSVVQALRDAGLDYIPVSCEEGVCGTCIVEILSGVPDHRDAILTQTERDGNKLFVACCSRSLSPVLKIKT
jgi:vanillate O-demethylase ferredoxin subunit